jgi:hypothetical protein
MEQTSDHVNACLQPSTKHQLVIEMVTVLSTVSTGQTSRVQIACTTNGTVTNHFIALQKLGVHVWPGQDAWIATLPVKIYCDAKSDVSIYIGRNSKTHAGPDAFGQNISISGHLKEP